MEAAFDDLVAEGSFTGRESRGDLELEGVGKRRSSAPTSWVSAARKTA